MEQIKVEFRPVHENAKQPFKKNPLDAGWDFSCVRDSEFFTPTKFSKLFKDYQDKYIYVLNPACGHLFDTGIQVAIPSEWSLVLFDRSGLGAKKLVHRTAGVIDSTYRGNILVSLINLSQDQVIIAEGDRIAQGLFIEVPLVEWQYAGELSETVRGEKGFGSSDLGV